MSTFLESHAVLLSKQYYYEFCKSLLFNLEVPILIHIHGGYWQEETVTPKNHSFIAKCLHKNKIKSIFIGYELCPKVTLREISKNIEIAVQKCLAYAKKHKSR